MLFLTGSFTNGTCEASSPLVELVETSTGYMQYFCTPENIYSGRLIKGKSIRPITSLVIPKRFNDSDFKVYINDVVYTNSDFEDYDSLNRKCLILDTLVEAIDNMTSCGIYKIRIDSNDPDLYLIGNYINGIRYSQGLAGFIYTNSIDVSELSR